MYAFLLCCWTSMVHLYCLLSFYQFSACFQHFLVVIVICYYFFFNNMFDSNSMSVNVFDQVDIIMWRLATCSMGGTMWSGSWAGVTSPLCGWPGTSSKMAPQLMSSWDLYFMNMVFNKTNIKNSLALYNEGEYKSALWSIVLPTLLHVCGVCCLLYTQWGFEKLFFLLV